MSCSQISWLLMADAPKALAEFYGFAMNAQVRQGLNVSHWYVANLEGLRIEIFSPSRTRPRPCKGRGFSLCLKGKKSMKPLLEIKEWSSKLVARGAVLLEKPIVEDFGVESWLGDPEGNQFLIVVPSIDY